MMLKVTNPYGLAPVGEIPIRDWSFANRWLYRAVRLHRDRRNRPPAHARIAILEKAAVIMRGKFDALAHGIADEGGKPLVDACVEVERAIDGVRLAASELAHLRGQEIPMDLIAAGTGRLAFTTREPIGSVVAISAFNHLLNLIVHQVAPVAAVGCPVIVKPADDTPLSAEAFVGILREAGLSKDRCALFACDILTAERLVTDPRVALFSFIVSANIGWMLRSKLAPGTRWPSSTAASHPSSSTKRPTSKR